MNISSIIFRIRMKYASSNKRADLMKEKFHHIGSNVNLYTTEFGTEPYLISIGDNVNVAAGVRFITHDISVFNVSRYLGLRRLDKVGKIELNDNCFIGAFSILMPNISVGEISIIAAGSVVTKNVPANEIWGGNPAQYIMSLDEYAAKLIDTNNKYPWLKDRNSDQVDNEEMILLREKYFFNDEDQ